MKTFKYYISTILLMFVINSLVAQNSLVITNVKLTNGTCLNNAKIEIFATGDSETMAYMLFNYTANKYVNPTTQSDNTFRDLEAGKYRVEVYDKYHNSSPVTRDVTLTTSYKIFYISSVTPSLKELCGDKPGQIYFVLANYTYPYNYTYRLKNETTGEVFIKENVTSYYYYFTGLSGGQYSYEIIDGCGSGITSPAGQYVTVEGGFDGVNFNKVTRGTTYYPQFTYLPGCTQADDQLQIYLYSYTNINYFMLDNIYDLANYDFQWTMEINGVMDNTWTSSKGYVGRYWYIKNFDYVAHNANKTKVRIVVKHPCTGNYIYSDYITNTATYNRTHTLSASTDNTASSLNFDDFCSSSATTAIRVYQSFYPSGCSNWKIHFIPSDGSATIIRSFIPSNYTNYYSDFPNKQGVTYKLELYDADGNLVTDKMGNSSGYSLYNSTTAFSLGANYIYTQHNYPKTGSYTTFTCYLSGSSSMSYITAESREKLKGTQLTYTITSAPAGVSRAPITFTYDGTTSISRVLWDDLPYGTYTIKIATSDGCTYNQSVTVQQAYQGFKGNTEVEAGTESACDKFNLTANPYFINMSGQAYYSVYQNVYPFIQKQGTTTWIRLGSIYISSSSMKTIVSSINTNANYGPGDYIIKYYPSNAYNLFNQAAGITPDNDFGGAVACFATEEFTVPEYKLPSLEIHLSGGITCDDTPGGTGGTLNMQGKDGNQPYWYRYRAYDPDLAETNPTGYSAWTQSQAISGLPAGRYTVQTRDNCNNFSTQNIKIFSGTEQFIGLVSSYNDNTVCETKSAEITVLSIGPVVSYQWYKDGAILPGETNHKLEINNMTSADEGEYSVVVDNGVCNNLTSDLKIRMLPVIVPVNDSLTVLPYQEKAFNLFANDSIASCSNDISPHDLTAADIQVEGYTKGVLQGEFGKIELVNEGNIIFHAPESYTKDVINFTYDVSITINGTLYKETASASIFFVQPTTFPSTVCYKDNYTFDLKKLSPNTSFEVKDTSSNAVTLPLLLSNMTSSKTYDITPSVNLLKYPPVSYTVQVMTSNGLNIRWKGTSDQVWNNYNNWVLINSNGTDGAKINWVPSHCTNAEIPSDSPVYPITADNSAIAKVTMKSRAMVGNSHKLSYKNVAIETSFNNADLNRWIMYSSPLKYMYSGDFILTDNAGKNIKNSTWMALFQTKDPDEGTITDALTITRPIADMEQDLILGKSFFLKIKDITGIDSETMKLPDLSTQYTYYKNSADDWGDMLPSVIKTSTLVRDANGGKFIIDKDNIVTGSNTVTVSIADVVAGSEVVMIANPFPAYLNVAAFLTENSATLEMGYWIWDGQEGALMKFNEGRGDTWTIQDTSIIRNNVATSNDYISPYQSFFAIRKNTTGTQLDVVFKPETMTTVEKVESTDYTLK